MKLKKNNKGFTLIELIVVIAIIGVLAGIAAPSIFSYISSAQIRADQSTAKQIQNAASLMYAQDSSNTYVDNVSGAVFWGHDKKTKLRYYIHEKLGTGSFAGYNGNTYVASAATTTQSGDDGARVTTAEEKALIPRPKENSHAFYMYLLPPYTVVSLQAQNSGSGATNELYTSGNIASVVNKNTTYLKERYPQVNYAQVIGAVEAAGGAASNHKSYVLLHSVKTPVWPASSTTATVVSNGGQNANGLNVVGWLNRGIDYGIAKITY